MEALVLQQALVAHTAVHVFQATQELTVTYSTHAIITLA